MIKKILAAGILAGFALAAQAHFGMVIPNHAMVVDQAQADLKLDVAFAHPMERNGMTMVKPAAMEVFVDGKKQDLRLGINGPYTQESIPGYLRQFRQLYPEAAIHLREGGREEILDALFQEELDVIVVPDYDLELDQRFDVLELNSERAKFMTGPHTPLAGRQYVSPEELVGQTIFRVEGLSEDPQGHPLPDYFVRLGLGENPVQRVKTYLEATILVQAGLGIAAIPGGMEGKLARDVSVFSIEGDSFRIRTVALRLLPPVSVAADHFFQVIRQDPERVKQGV